MSLADLRLRRSDGVLLVLALLSSALFFSHVSQLWPMIPGNLRHLPGDWRAQAVGLDELLGTDLAGFTCESRLRVDGPGLDCVEHRLGRARAVQLIRQGLPVAWHKATFKRAGDPDSVTVAFLLDGRLLGWERSVQEDMSSPDPQVDPERIAHAAAARLVDSLDGYSEIEHGEHTFPTRTDRHWLFERAWPDTGAVPLRERIEIQLSGTEVVKCWRSLVLPGEASREERADAVPRQSLEAVGFSLLAAAGVIAAAIALRRLALGQARLGPAARIAIIVGVLLVVTHALQPALIFEQWDPLGPRWLAAGKELIYDLMDDLSVLIMLFFFMVAGDALDRLPPGDAPGERQLAPRRAASLWALGSGRLGEWGVIAASLRGFLVGAVCGGVLAGGTLLAVAVLHARVQLQPRGFFFYPLNAWSPPLITLCFFTQIALLEELGYRFFAGTWLERLTGSRYLAVLIPAAVYGLCHTNFEFLPPADPWWFRPLLLAGVGSIWGWAFFRFDALTVVLSHLTCDLFIFNWPLMQLGGWNAVEATLVIMVPLLPAGVGLALQLHSRPAAARS